MESNGSTFTEKSNLKSNFICDFIILPNYVNKIVRACVYVYNI